MRLLQREQDRMLDHQYWRPRTLHSPVVAQMRGQGVVIQRTGRKLVLLHLRWAAATWTPPLTALAQTTPKAAGAL
jgi:hypothetical protein